MRSLTSAHPPGKPGGPFSVRIPPDDDPCGAGDCLRTLMRATVAGDRLLARRLRLHFRRAYRLDVTLGRRAELRRAVEAGHLLDELVLAARSKKFARATAVHIVLQKAFDVYIVPLAALAKAEGGPR